MITITQSANSRIKEMMANESEDQLFLRLGVQGGGCTGLSYGMGFDSRKKEDDTSFETNGLQVIIDGESAPLLQGVTIDYKQNMMGGGFTLDNPNAVATCGCGQSFKTAENEGAPSTGCGC